MRYKILIAFTCALLSGCDNNGTHKDSRRIDDARAAGIIALGNAEIKVLDLETENEKLRQRIEDMKIDAESAREQANIQCRIARNEGRLEVFRERLAAAHANTAAAVTPRTRTSSYTPPSGMTPTTASEAAGWRYPTAHEAKEFVKRDAKAKWANNYRMVEYDITRQMEAYEKLKTYEQKRWSDPAIRQVLNVAGNKWGSNYGMIFYEVDGQLAAKSRTEGRR